MYWSVLFQHSELSLALCNAAIILYPSYPSQLLRRSTFCSAVPQKMLRGAISFLEALSFIFQSNSGLSKLAATTDLYTAQTSRANREHLSFRRFLFLTSRMTLFHELKAVRVVRAWRVFFLIYARFSSIHSSFRSSKSNALNLKCRAR